MWRTASSWTPWRGTSSTASPPTWRDKPVTAGGEGFEQREIPVGRGLLYVHLWDGQDWEMSQAEPGREKEGWTLDKVFKVEITPDEPDGYRYATQMDLPARGTAYTQVLRKARVANFVKMETEVLQVYQGPVTTDMVDGTPFSELNTLGCCPLPTG